MSVALGICLGTSKITACIFDGESFHRVQFDKKVYELPTAVCYSSGSPQLAYFSSHDASLSANVLYHITGFLGLTYRNAVKYNDLLKLHHRIVRDALDKSAFIIGNDTERMTQTPEQAVSFLLKQAKVKAEKMMQRPISEVFITIPDNCTRFRLLETTYAAKTAGFTSVRFIKQIHAILTTISLQQTPMFYGKMDRLIVNIGTVATEVSYCTMQDCGMLKVTETYCENIGGNDVDLALMNYCDDEGCDDLHFRLDCESAKMRLSRYPKKVALVSAAGGHSRITTDAFEALCGRTVFRIIELMKKIVWKVHRSNDKAEFSILLVGGSSRTSLVEKMTKWAFPSNPVQRSDIKALSAEGAVVFSKLNKKLSDNEITDADYEEMMELLQNFPKSPCYKDIVQNGLQRSDAEDTVDADSVSSGNSLCSRAESVDSEDAGGTKQEIVKVSVGCQTEEAVSSSESNCLINGKKGNILYIETVSEAQADFTSRNVYFTPPKSV